MESIALPRSNTAQIDAITSPMRFEREVKTVPFGSGTIRVVNLTPVLSPQQLEKRRREVENCLYAVFSKYVDQKRV